MQDAIPIPALLREGLTPLADLLHLQTLPLHIHEVILSYILYNLLNALLAPRLSAFLLPTAYGQFPSRTRLLWNIHVTSFVNATLVSAGALYVLYADRDLLSGTWEERLFGYTGGGGMVQALATGYFVWDLQVCATNIDTLGVANLLHAVVALSIAVLGFVRELHCTFSWVSPVSCDPAYADSDSRAAPFWLVQRNSVCVDGAVYALCQYSLVPE